MRVSRCTSTGYLYWIYEHLSRASSTMYSSTPSLQVALQVLVARELCMVLYSTRRIFRGFPSTKPDLRTHVLDLPLRAFYRIQLYPNDCLCEKALKSIVHDEVLSVYRFCRLSRCLCPCFPWRYVSSLSECGFLLCVVTSFKYSVAYLRPLSSRQHSDHDVPFRREEPCRSFPALP